MLLLVPLLAFVVPALCNAPALSGDNLIQNFPLRAFSGELLRQGHLPLWNPFIWSGSPLLGGMNAGSFFPLTFLFVVVPAIGAWVLNMTAVYWVAGLGTYWLLRQYGMRPLAGFLGAAVYAYSGVMIGQMVHLGIIQGMALMPVIVLAILKISWAVFGVGPATRTRSTEDGLEAPGADLVESGVPSPPWPWVVGLAVLVGLIMLTGEPRSIAETEIVGAALALWLTLRGYGDAAVSWGRRLRFLGAIVLAGAWGVAIGAAQLLPGYDFINLSQRANEPYSFFASGSLHTQWTVLLLVPDLFGGSGTLHQPVYFNGYNLPEVTGYVGLLPLVACAALLTRTFGRNRDRAAADWAPWLFFALLGLLLAWGQYTPLGGLFGHIWIFGRTRLQSRSLGIVDLALAVLFAFWADRGLGKRHQWLGTAGWRRWVSAAPPMAAAVVCVVAIAFQRQLESAFGAFRSGAGMTPWFVAQLVVALAVVALVLGWRHLGVDRARWVLSAVVVVDLTLFGLSSATGFASATPDVVEPSKAEAASVLGTEGRFAIYYPASNYVQLGAIGQPDLNVFTTLPSVQGYGSIVDNTYGTATGSHFIDSLDPCALARGVFTPLRLRTLLTGPAQLAPEVPSSGVAAEPVRSLPGGPAGRHGQGADVVLRPSPHTHRRHAGHPDAQRLDCAGRLESGPAQGGRRGRLPRAQNPGRRRPRHCDLPLAGGRRGTGRPGEPPGGVGHLRGHRRRRPPLRPGRQRPGRPRPARVGLHRHVGGERPLRAGARPTSGLARTRTRRRHRHASRDRGQRHGGRPGDHVGTGAPRAQRVQPPGMAGHGGADHRRGVPTAPDPCRRADPGSAPAGRLLDGDLHVPGAGPRPRAGRLGRRHRRRADRGRGPGRPAAPGPARCGLKRGTGPRLDLYGLEVALITHRSARDHADRVGTVWITSRGHRLRLEVPEEQCS